jgi:hypothetical protein
MRQIFLSRRLYQTYGGYVRAQFRKIEQDVRTRGAIRPKHAMHLIRLVLAGIEALREGVLPVRVERDRDRLLAIRRDELPWVEIAEWQAQLHREFDDAFARTALPDEPDYARADAFLIAARRSRAREERAE